MALEATHLRFAFALKDDLGVRDSEKFAAGAVYPDTRYLTGIDRRLTHDFGYFSRRPELSDFEKGWLSHLLGDRVFRRVAEDKFPDLFLSDELEERWVAGTAVKIIQDVFDAGSFDLPAILPLLDYYELHFHEDERKVVEYQRIIRKTYEKKAKITAEDDLWMWEQLGTSSRNLSRLRRKLVELNADASLVGDIEGNFADGMDLYREKYRAHLRRGEWAECANKSI